MFNMTRRTLLGSATAAAAFGLAGRLEFTRPAFAET
ncbi:MBL fold metallo-hydrolase, partial [Mesorhizobium sp. M7A.F.Ca.US.002.01.1.1]